MFWSVRDQGQGLSAAEIAQLFVPFSRLARNEKMASGSGLGLSIVKKIVEAHGGQINVESQPGDGADFRDTTPPDHSDKCMGQKRMRSIESREGDAAGFDDWARR